MKLITSEFNCGVLYSLSYKYSLITYYKSLTGIPLIETSQAFDMILETGAVYSLTIREENKGEVVFHQLQALTSASSVHVFWLLPQYLLISVAEILFAVSGLEFSFTQV